MCHPPLIFNVDASRCIAILSPFQSCCHQEFVKLMHEGGTTLAYGPKQKTHGWQPIDRGHIGATLKAMMRQEQQLWLEDPATLSPSQSCCHGLWFASLMLHSALPFCHPPICQHPARQLLQLHRAQWTKREIGRLQNMIQAIRVHKFF